MHSRWIIASLGFAVLMAGPLAQAADWWVPQDFPTINAAVASAEDGDRILISPGEHEESTQFIQIAGRELTFEAPSGEVRITDSCVFNGPDLISWMGFPVREEIHRAIAA
jgi:hypothetical protein